jgi:hypothetical protein
VPANSFATYSESLPYVGFDGDSYTTVSGQNQYERKHNPVADWMNDSNPTPNQLPSWVNQPFTTFQNLGRADAWLKANILDTYLPWAMSHISNTRPSYGTADML